MVVLLKIKHYLCIVIIYHVNNKEYEINGFTNDKMTITRLKKIHEEIQVKVDKFIDKILDETKEVDDVDTFVTEKRILVEKEIDRLVREIPDKY